MPVAPPLRASASRSALRGSSPSAEVDRSTPPPCGRAHGAGRAARSPANASTALAAWLAAACASLLLVAGTATAQTVFEVRVSASTDDAEQFADSTMYLSSTDLELIHDTTDQTVGMRWVGLPIPSGATITAAWIQFAAKESQSEATTLTLRAQASDAASTFSSTRYNIGSRPRTTASVSWTPPAWSSGQIGSGQRTPDLKSIVQEVVNRSGWATGHPLAIIVNGTGHRTAYSWNGDTLRAPLLHIEYTTSGPAPADQPPVASLAVTQLSSPALTVSASAAGSTDGDVTPIASYSFDFGDGTPAVVVTAPTQAATHTYAAAATYTVTLIATDTGGLSSTAKTASITVTPPAPAEQAPVASLAVTQLSSPALTVSASAAGSTDGDATPIASYSFDFGDGTPAAVVTAPTQTATHTYAAAATYTVTLIATDTGGLASAAKTASITVLAPSATATVESRVAASSDDAEQTLTGSMYLNSSDLELIHDSSDQVVGMRWTGLAVPQGAVITAAWIQFSAKESQSEVTTLAVRAQAADNASTFVSSSNNVSSRPLTTASTAWAPVAWTAGEIGANQRTPDLSAVVQEVVSRAGWASGNALAIVVTGTGHRTAYAWDGSSTKAPLLHIEYTTDGSAPPPPPATDLPPVAKLSVTQAPSPALTVSASAVGSTDGDATPIASYSFSFGDGTAPVVTNATTQTAAHTYASAGTYTVTLIATDTGGLSSTPVTASITVNPPSSSPIAVYVGYYDTHHPNLIQPKPNPWQGSAGVTFVGKADDSSNNWDSSCLRVDNLTGSSMSVVVTCDIGSSHYALWGTQTIPANGKLILAQTAFQNFDGSDTSPAGCYGCDPSLCLTKVVSTIPVVHVTVGGVTTNYYDGTQVLNTKGADGAGCPYTGTRNDESQQWKQIGTSTSALAFNPPDSDMGGESRIPARLALAAPAPNPVRDMVILRYALPTTSRAVVGLYDVAGRLVKTLLEREMPAGEFQQGVSVTGVDPGVYFIQLRTAYGGVQRSVVVTR